MVYNTFPKYGPGRDLQIHHRLAKVNLTRDSKLRPLFLPRGNSSLYGGDLGTILDLMETSIKNLHLQSSSSLYRQDQSKLKVSIVARKNNVRQLGKVLKKAWNFSITRLF